MAPKTVERELLELERRYWQAIQDKDVDAAPFGRDRRPAK
jgi:hypothetical protein